MKKFLMLVITVAMLASAPAMPVQAAGNTESAAPGLAPSFCQPQTISNIFPVFEATGVATESTINETLDAMPSSGLSQGGHDPCNPPTSNCNAQCETRCTQWREGYMNMQCGPAVSFACEVIIEFVPVSKPIKVLRRIGGVAKWITVITKVYEVAKRRVCHPVAWAGCYVPRSCVGGYETVCTRR